MTRISSDSFSEAMEMRKLDPRVINYKQLSQQDPNKEMQPSQKPRGTLRNVAPRMLLRVVVGFEWYDSSASV